jgi:antitoxin component of MazEF toxin-antitoxin module
MELAKLKVGDQVDLEIHSGGTITITPLKPKPEAADVSDAIQDVMKRYAKTMRRLA